MIRCSCTQSSGLDKRELYAYVAGCPCYIWASTCFYGYVLHFRPTKTQASLCRLALAFVTNIHKVWMKIKTRNKIWTPSPTRCVMSLTEKRNATLAGGMPPLTNSDVFNLPIKPMTSGFNSLHAGIFSIIFVICWFYLIWVQTVLLKLSAGGTCI